MQSSVPDFDKQIFCVVHFSGASRWSASGAVALVRTESLQSSFSWREPVSRKTSRKISAMTKPAIVRTSVAICEDVSSPLFCIFILSARDL